MNFPEEILQSVAVYHLPTVKSGATQPYPTNPNATLDLALIPMDRKNHALEGLVLVNPFEIYADADEDLRVGDKLIVGDGSYEGTYYCKKIFLADFGGLPHQRLSISLEI